jgi:endonuclease III
VDEALQLSNGKDIRSLLFENRPDGLVATLLEEPNTEKQVEKAYINILNRLPTQSETETMTRFLSLERTQAKNQLESMIWVLLTSPECRLNH